MTETVSKEKIGGVCRMSPDVKPHPKNKSGGRETRISAGKSTQTEKTTLFDAARLKGWHEVIKKNDPP